MARRILAASAVLLGLFHAWLFAGQVLDGRLADPSALGKWALAAGLVWLLWRVSRQEQSIFSGRKAVSIWLLAAVLHAPAVATRLDSTSAPDVSEVVVALVQVTLGVGVVLLS